jgi:hypothetical protein
MSIVNILDDVNSEKYSHDLTQMAAEYGLVCFKIELLQEVGTDLPYKLANMKFELEGKLKQLLYA